MWLFFNFQLCEPKVTFSNHPFTGANLLLVLVSGYPQLNGGITNPYINGRKYMGNWGGLTQLPSPNSTKLQHLTTGKTRISHLESSHLLTVDPDILESTTGSAGQTWGGATPGGHGLRMVSVIKYLTGSMGRTVFTYIILHDIMVYFHGFHVSKYTVIPYMGPMGTRMTTCLDVRTSTFNIEQLK